MRRAIGLVVLAVVTSGCASLLPPHLAGPRAGAHIAGRYAAQPLPPPVVGRWDNVVALPPRTAIGVITTDGSAATGLFLRAGLRSLTMQAAGIEVELRRDDVMRVDVLSREGRRGGDVARGAARGALALGGALMVVPYLLTGDVWVPPARVWAAGAVVGAAGALQEARFRDAERTIYVSSELVR